MSKENIIPLEKLESDAYEHSDYNRIHVDRYKTSLDHSTKHIYEVDKFPNPFDFISQHKVTFEVYVGCYPEANNYPDLPAGLANLPKGARTYNQEIEPMDDGTFQVFAVFEEIQSAYNYAISEIFEGENT